MLQKESLLRIVYHRLITSTPGTTSVAWIRTLSSFIFLCLFGSFFLNIPLQIMYHWLNIYLTATFDLI